MTYGATCDKAAERAHQLRAGAVAAAGLGFLPVGSCPQKRSASVPMPRFGGCVEIGSMIRVELDLRAKAGRRDELLAVLGKIDVLTAVNRQPGFVGAEIQLGVDDRQHVLMTSSWASKEHFERWQASPAWAELLDQVQSLVSRKPIARAFRVVDLVEAA